MCSSEGCGSLDGAQSSTYRRVSRAPFFYHRKIALPFETQACQENVVAQFTGLPALSSRAPIHRNEAISWRGLRSPRTAESELAMIKGEVPRFHRGNYRSLEMKDEDNI